MITNEKTFPHVRAMTVCLSCGKAKNVGLLVCWPCHNEFALQYDVGYGPVMDRVLPLIEARLRERGAPVAPLTKT